MTLPGTGSSYRAASEGALVAPEPRGGPTVTVLATLAAAGAAVALWAGAGRHRPAVARGYRWLAAAALFWAAGLTMQLALAGSLGSSGALSLADVAPLLALGPTAVGSMVLASPRPLAAEGDAGAPRGGERRAILPGPVLPGLAGGVGTAVSLLALGWIVAFGAGHHHSTGARCALLLD